MADFPPRAQLATAIGCWLFSITAIGWLSWMFP